MSSSSIKRADGHGKSAVCFTKDVVCELRCGINGHAADLLKTSPSYASSWKSYPPIHVKENGHGVCMYNQIRCTLAEKQDWPDLERSGQITSDVFHLLPHAEKFENNMILHIPLKFPIWDSIPVLFYSETAPGEGTHWEMVLGDNKTQPNRRIIEILQYCCTVSMPSFCLACIAFIESSAYSDIGNPDKQFTVHFGLVFERETIGEGSDKRNLVHVSVLISRQEFDNILIKKSDRLSVVRDTFLKEVRIQMYGIKPHWQFDNDDQQMVDVSVFQLWYGKRKEVSFCYYSDNNAEENMFQARVRVHQTNARNDCELYLEDRSFLGNMVERVHAQRNGAAVQHTGHMISQLYSNISQRQLNGLTMQQTANSVDTLSVITNKMMQEIANAVDSYVEDGGILQSLDRELDYDNNLQEIVSQARHAHVSPSFRLLQHWRETTGGNIEQLSLIHRKYVI